MRDVYAIYESRSDGRDRSRWVRVGVAFDNRDGSVNVLLDALPLSGRLQIRSRPSESAAEAPAPAPRTARPSPDPQSTKRIGCRSLRGRAAKRSPCVTPRIRRRDPRRTRGDSESRGLE